MLVVPFPASLSPFEEEGSVGSFALLTWQGLTVMLGWKQRIKTFFGLQNTVQQTYFSAFYELLFDA